MSLFSLTSYLLLLVSQNFCCQIAGSCYKSDVNKYDCKFDRVFHESMIMKRLLDAATAFEPKVLNVDILQKVIKISTVVDRSTKS